MPIGMDFTLGEAEQAVASAAAEALEHARPPEEPGTPDRALWKELSRAGLLSLALPASPSTRCGWTRRRSATCLAPGPGAAS